MLTKELIGKKITNIFTFVEHEHYGIDTAKCFIEIDDKIIIGFPLGGDEEVWIKELNPKAISIFEGLPDEVVHPIIKEKNSFWGRIKTFFNIEIIPDSNNYYDYRIKQLQNRIITDFLWYQDEIENGFIELDNGYIITEKTVAMNGTGLAGLNYYKNFETLSERRNLKIVRLTEKRNTPGN